MSFLSCLLLLLLSVIYTSVVVADIDVGVYSALPQNPAGSVVKASCATYNNVLSDGTLAMCAGLIDYDYYLPDGYTQETLEVLAYGQIIKDADTQVLLGLLPPTCSIELKKVTCASVFQKCFYVDTFFTDGNCGATGICEANTTASGTAPVSVCRNMATSALESKGCVASIGTVSGAGATTWALAAAAATVTTEVFCASQNMTYNADSESCHVAIPVNPAKSLCDELNNADTTVSINGLTGVPEVAAKCPLISGYFYPVITNMLGVDNTLNDLNLTTVESDPYITAQLSAKLVDQNCQYPQNATACATIPFTVNLMSLLGQFPSCNDPNPSAPAFFTFSETFIGESVAFNRASQTSLGELIAGKAAAVKAAAAGLEAACGCNGANCDASITCASLTANALANSAVNTNNLVGQPGVAFVKDLLPGDNTIAADGTTVSIPEVCQEVITADVNQPPAGDLAILQGSYLLPSVEDAKGAFFVSSAIGLPPLAHSYGFTGNDNSSAFTLFMSNAFDQTKPLCSVDGAAEGFNSVECVVNSVKTAIGLLPKWVNPTCRIALEELACASGFLKPEFKRMCLIPDVAGGCADTPVAGAATNTMPFLFALPRFPSQAMCLNAKTECAGFLGYLEQTDPTLAVSLSDALDCDATIDLTCENQQTEWTSAIWPTATACSSPFNGKASFPDGSASLANILELGGDFLQFYVTSYSLDEAAFVALGTSETVSPAISNLTEAQKLESCECPYPMVVPDSGIGLTDYICCQEICTGSMFEPEEFDLWINAQFYFNLASLLGAVFILVTYTTFKSKRKQTLTIAFSITSICIALVFMVTTGTVSNAQELFCRDNTQGNTQEDGGLCLAQSVLICSLPVTACSYWFFTAVDLWLKVVVEKRNYNYNKFYHGIALTLPLIVAAVYGGTSSFGYEKTTPWCSFSNGGLAVELALFYGLIGFYMVVGFLLMIAVIVKIYKVTAKTREYTATVGPKSGARSFKGFAKYRTALFFVVFFLFIWVTVFTWRFTVLAQTPDITVSATAWYGCLLQNFANGIVDPARNASADTTLIDEWLGADVVGCGTTYPQQISYDMMWVLQGMSLLQGVFVFLIYGAKKDVVELWANRFGFLSKIRISTTTGSSYGQKSGSSFFSRSPRGAKTTIETTVAPVDEKANLE